MERTRVANGRKPLTSQAQLSARLLPSLTRAAVAELVDAQRSGRCVLRDVEVRVLSAAWCKAPHLSRGFSFLECRKAQLAETYSLKFVFVPFAFVTAMLSFAVTCLPLALRIALALFLLKTIVPVASFSTATVAGELS
jgi:hypothetical protein